MFYHADAHAKPLARTVPKRSAVAVGDTWDLSQLYADDAAWDADFARYEKNYPRYLEFKDTLSSSAARLQACLEFDREMDLLAEQLGHYASLRSAEDSSDNANLAREARFAHLLTLAAETAAFLTPEIQAVADRDFARFLADPALAEWRGKLERLRRFKPHILSTQEERLLALAALPLGAAAETFSQLTNVDMTFGVITDETGADVELSHGAFSSFLVKRDPALRRRAFAQYYAAFDAHKFTVSATLAHAVKRDVFNARARNFPSARAAALFADNVPVSVYDNLIATVRNNLGALHEYYELRRRTLGLAELHFHDTYVPLTGSVSVRTTFDQARTLVLDSLAPLGAEYVGALRAGLASRWVDHYETKGKRSGAFSSSSYTSPPYILLNYQDDVFSDIYTLTHEAGHSMHSWHSQRAQKFQDYNYPIFLAEVASTFNEELLTHHLLQTTADRDMRAYILNRQIDDIRATLIRQTMFAEFEQIIHAMDEAGEPLTLESFRAEYRKLLEAYHGPGLVIDDALELECLRIPHFYGAFYVYKYATGISAALALSAGVLQNPATHREPYLHFLKSGGSQFPLDTLRLAGVDMSTPAPVQAALDLFQQRVRELAALL
ncbi:MAG: oligoendopeptidase F [Verrucomicrobiales bacterium]|jgi:oligoendopeptidase F|nr:oligoendopeptidase F [Verrucomicrobiales bacterium]